MPTAIEKRVAVLEREVSSLKNRLETVDTDVQALPDLIKAQGRFVYSQLARVRAEVADLRTAMGVQFDAVLRAVSQGLAEIKGKWQKALPRL